MLVVFISLNAHAQLRNAVEEEQVQQSDVVPSEYSRRQETPARRLTTYEYSRLMQTHVYQPEPEPGQFGGVVYLGDGEWRLCDRAPEPSSLSLLLAGGAVLAGNRKRLKRKP